MAPVYQFEMPVTLVQLGYSTTSIGKDHFGWVSQPDGDVAFNTPDAEMCLDKEADGDSGSTGALDGEEFPPPYGPNVGHGVPHGYQQTSLYDGIVAEPDDYHQWFQRQMGGKEPESGWPELDMNSWRGEAYAYANESLHPTAWVGRQAVEFIEDRSPFISNSSFKDAPWFLKVSFHRPHSPYDPPQRFIDKTPLSSLRPVHTCRPGDPLAWDHVFSTNTNGCGPDKLDAWCGTMPANDSAFARVCYQANIAFIDEWIGNIFTALESTKQLEATYILYVADHGDGQSDHFHWRKGFPYEFSSHVPFMLRWPENAAAMGESRAAGWERGVTIDNAVVELRDVFPTMLDAIGRLNGGDTPVPHGYKMDGDSLLCTLTKKHDSCRGGKWRPWLDLEHYKVYNATVHWNMLFDGEMKFIFHAFWAQEDPRQFQLFNLTADPNELRDLARSPDHVGELAKWKKVMAAQFLEEGRDKYGFVSADGVLQGDSFRNLTARSPNYPARSPGGGGGGGKGHNQSLDCDAAAAAALKSGAPVVLAGHAAGELCQGFTCVLEGRYAAAVCFYQPSCLMFFFC